MAKMIETIRLKVNVNVGFFQALKMRLSGIAGALERGAAYSFDITEENSTLVFSFEEQIRMEHAEAVRKYISSMLNLSKTKVIVISGNPKISVIKKLTKEDNHGND